MSITWLSFEFIEAVIFPDQRRWDLGWSPFDWQYHSTKVPTKFGHRRHCKMPASNSFDKWNMSLSVTPNIHLLRLPSVFKKFRFSSRSFHLLKTSVELKRKPVTWQRNITMYKKTLTQNTSETPVSDKHNKEFNPFNVPTIQYCAPLLKTHFRNNFSIFHYSLLITRWKCRKVF